MINIKQNWIMLIFQHWMLDPLLGNDPAHCQEWMAFECKLKWLRPLVVPAFQQPYNLLSLLFFPCHLAVSQVDSARLWHQDSTAERHRPNIHWWGSRKLQPGRIRNDLTGKCFLTYKTWPLYNFLHSRGKKIGLFRAFKGQHFYSWQGGGLEPPQRPGGAQTIAFTKII